MITVTLPSTWHFDPKMMRLIIREFARWANPVGGATLVSKLEKQLCDGPGCLDEETYVIFSKWYHTDGAYKSAEHVAQAISLMVYGRIIERHESTIRPPYPRRAVA
jgi:hypothetical protein